MINFFAFVITVLFVLMAIGMFKPSTALPKFLAFNFLPLFAVTHVQKTVENPTRWKVLIWYGCAIFGVFTAATFFVDGITDNRASSYSKPFTEEHFFKSPQGNVSTEALSQLFIKASKVDSTQNCRNMAGNAVEFVGTSLDKLDEYKRISKQGFDMRGSVRHLDNIAAALLFDLKNAGCVER